MALIPFGAAHRLGIDLGTQSIKVCLGEVRKAEARCCAACAIDREELPAEDPRALAEALADRCRSLSFPLDNVVLALPVASTMIRYVTVPPAPDWRVDLLAHYEIEEVSNRLGEQLCAGWRTEPFPNDEGQRPLFCAFAKEQEISDLIAAFEAAGFRIASAVPVQEALFQAYLHLVDPPPREEPSALLEIGSRYAHVLLCMEGRLLFTRQARCGGEVFTSVLSERVAADPPQLELLKRRSTGLEADGSKRDFSGLFRRPAGQVVNLVKGALAWAEGHLKQGPLKLSEVVLSGGGARLQGLDRYLEQTLGVPVRRAEVRRTAAPESLLGDLPYGFLPSAGLTTVSPEKEQVLQVLPEAVRRRQRFWRETVYLYGAGILLVCFLLLQFSVGLRHYMARHSLMDRLREVKTRLEGDSLRYEEIQSTLASIARRRKALQSMLWETAFSAKVLLFLSQSLDPAIQLVAVEGARVEKNPGRVVLQLEGLADNANRQAVALIQRLQEALGKLEGVREVALLSEYWRLEAERNAYRFRLRIQSRTPQGGERAVQ